MFGPRHEHRLGIILDEVEQLPAAARLLDGAVGLGQLARRMQQRGYRVTGIDSAFEAALFDGFDIVKAKFWGFPVVLAYDTVFLLPMNKRRARRAVSEDAALQSVARVGRARWLVNVVRAVFSIDRLFGWIPFGPGLLL